MVPIRRVLGFRLEQVILFGCYHVPLRLRSLFILRHYLIIRHSLAWVHGLDILSFWSFDLKMVFCQGATMPPYVTDMYFNMIMPSYSLVI
jgi:prepilin signal peptidase PulO-like enzyme (type II secretory pathway)